MKRFGWVLLLMGVSVQAMAQTILVFGDSISAAYGMEVTQGWTDRLQETLQALPGHEGDRIANASISGETSLGGLARLGQELSRHKPDWVLLELGANDGLRGLPPATLKANLAEIIRQSQQAGARVLLLGMKIPPSYGARYIQMYHEVYGQLAGEFNIPLIPFILEDVSLDPGLMQADGLHPNAKAQPLIAKKVADTLLPLLNVQR